MSPIVFACVSINLSCASDFYCLVMRFIIKYIISNRFCVLLIGSLHRVCVSLLAICCYKYVYACFFTSFFRIL